MDTGSLWKGLFALQDFGDLVGVLSSLLQCVMNGLLSSGQALQAALIGGAIVVEIGGCEGREVGLRQVKL